MCVIIQKPADTKISKELFQAAWTANPHGAGLAIFGESKVIVVKTLKLAKAWKAYQRYADQEMLLHFRIKTSGLTDIDNVHPFKVSDYEIVAHNGVLHKYDLSKTACDSKILARVLGLHSTLEERIDLLKDLAKSFNKFALMGFDPGTRQYYCHLIGDFQEHEGLKCSNLYFLPTHNRPNQYIFDDENFAYCSEAGEEEKSPFYWNDDFYTNQKKENKHYGKNRYYHRNYND